MVEELYRRQGDENGGWVSEELLAEVAARVGLDYDRVRTDRGRADVGSKLAAAEQAARLAGVAGTPAFALGRTGGRLALVRVTSLAPGGIVPAIDAALGG